MKTDPAAPATLFLEIKDAGGRVWGTMVGNAKLFSSGSVGYFASGKIENPDSHERYQVGSNITLIGSSEESAKKQLERTANKTAGAYGKSGAAVIIAKTPPPPLPQSTPPPKTAPADHKTANGQMAAAV